MAFMVRTASPLSQNPKSSIMEPTQPRDEPEVSFRFVHVLFVVEEPFCSNTCVNDESISHSLEAP